MSAAFKQTREIKLNESIPIGVGSAVSLVDEVSPNSLLIARH